MSRPIRLGTRSSALARWQAQWVAEALRNLGVEVELIHISTTGDVTSGPLGQIGGQGLFTKEIQRALLANEIDLAVHSLKDLPTAPVDGLKLAAVPPREEVGDCLISSRANSLQELPEKARIGTGSLRRKAQILHVRPDLVIEDIRGNLDTRLRKLDEGQYEAIVLAEAGLRRLGWADRIAAILPKSQMLPAVGQGALGLETRDNDDATQAVVASLNDAASMLAVVAERALLFTLRGGCLAPVGAWGRLLDDQSLQLDAVVLSGNGEKRIHAAAATGKGMATLEAASTLGQHVAEMLIGQGATELIASARLG
jgi:hydroxymethylbilane synthase